MLTKALRLNSLNLTAVMIQNGMVYIREIRQIRTVIVLEVALKVIYNIEELKT